MLPYWTNAVSPFVWRFLIIFIYFQGGAPMPCHRVWRSKVSLWESVFSLDHAFSRDLTPDWPQAPFPVEPSWAPHLIQHYPRYRPTWTEHINAPWCPCPQAGPAVWLNTCEYNMDSWEPNFRRYESKRRNVYVLNEWWLGSCWQTLTLFWHGPSVFFRVMLSYSNLCHFPEP